MISKKTKQMLEKMHYGLVGESSAVQICRWTKNSLNGNGVCWKEKFYGIKSHRCCEMTPAVMWCENACLHCWRPIEHSEGFDMKKIKIENPKKLLDEIIEKRKQLMIGFKGDNKISKLKVKEAFEPTLFTFSLSGEPTLYPRLSGLIKEIRKRKAISFLVTNGLNPEAIKKLEKSKSLPTQLTISMNAPNEKLYKLWHNSKKKNAWKKFNETLILMKKLKGKTRRAIRLTLVQKGKSEGIFKNLTNMSLENVKEYSKLILKANPDFIHVKGFKSVGYSRNRLGYDKQPFHKEVKDFSKLLMNDLNENLNKNEKPWKILGEENRSCVVVLGKDKKDMKIREKEI